MILIDVDTFKSVNDTYGHAMGDTILQKVATLLKRTFRSIDYVCRIGGDEFVIIMTEKTEELQKIIKDFEQKSALWHGELVDSISVSYGYVFSSEEAWNGIYDIAKAADERMYKSKSCYYRESGLDRRR